MQINIKEKIIIFICVEISQALKKKIEKQHKQANKYEN